MLAGFCERVLAAGLPLGSLTVVVDTLHPTHEGHAIRWRRNEPETAFFEYGRTNQGEMAENYRRSTFYQLFHSGETYLRERLSDETLARYWNLEPDRDAGMKEFLAVLTRFGPSGTIGDMDCVYSSWFTDLDRGFNDDEIAAIKRLVPFLAGAVKSLSLEPRRALPGRDLSRPRCQPAGAGRADRARRRRPHRGCAVVQRPQRLHPDHRQRAARADHSAAQRLCRGGGVRDPRPGRRRAEADRRRRAGDLHLRRQREGLCRRHRCRARRGARRPPR